MIRLRRLTRLLRTLSASALSGVRRAVEGEKDLLHPHAIEGSVRCGQRCGVYALGFETRFGMVVVVYSRVGNA